ncbi:MULE transposase domain-containing protein [Hirsutella rhossiliensis]|uniref:MULE transposase domain-containing protein n=1 Tax=Hirsutella rhossiliensis TaxID=111463 RepID=A0A9P8MLG1_9HYPO|nr:MULE transposase domain-containing protein [Hirsutella rhossiliensis]KAH0957225.1 MULE transposase domain-containing protein [Hirsutella rhossiliensis]
MESLTKTLFPTFQAAMEAADTVAEAEATPYTFEHRSGITLANASLHLFVVSRPAPTKIGRIKLLISLVVASIQQPRKQTKYRDDIIRKFNNNTRPTDIAGELRDLVHDDPRLAGITAQDVSNALARHRQEELAGRTPLQFLYDRLDKSDFFHRDSRDPQGRLTGLFLAPRATFHRWRQHHDVLVLDCTYKTNRFNMPLLNICAATRDNKTFSIASIFLNGETESHYYWAISLLLVLCEKESIPFQGSLSRTEILRCLRR